MKERKTEKGKAKMEAKEKSSKGTALPAGEIDSDEESEPVAKGKRAKVQPPPM